MDKQHEYLFQQFRNFMIEHSIMDVSIEYENIEGIEVYSMEDDVSKCRRVIIIRSSKELEVK